MTQPLPPSDRAVVLVVDDDDACRYVTCHHLRQAGYTILEATTAHEALELAEQIPDGIVLDVKLPDLSGFEVCRRLRADPRTTAIPVLHLSAAYPDEASRIAGLEGGADGYLTLPVDPAVLLAHVQALVRSGRLLREIQEREQHFRVLFEASIDGLGLLDPATRRIVMVNHALARMLGQVPEDLVGRAAEEFIPPERHPVLIREAARVASGERTFSPNLEIPRRDGSVLHASISFSRLCMDGRTCVLCSVRDETARRALEHRLAQSSRLASVGLLAAGVAHELNNPLAWVLYNLQTMTDDIELLAEKADAALAAQIGPIRTHLIASVEGARRMRGIVADLQIFSRVEPDTRAALDLRPVVRAAAAMAHNEIRFRARLELALGHSLPVWGNEGRLSQVLLNLLVNAAQSMEEGHPERHTIRVQGTQDGDHVRISMADTGHGIEPALLTRIFDPFFTTREPGDGVGMGLALCHAIVTEHGGHIEVTSEPGRGSCFTVVLPRHRPSPEHRPPATPAPMPARTRALRVLVIDDEPHLVRALTRLLTREGHTVVGACSGREAEGLLARDTAFDVVLCDLMMPDLLGIDLHAGLVERDPALARRFLFLTGGTFTPRAQEYLSTTANPVLGKPTPRERLLATIETLAAATTSGPGG